MLNVEETCVILVSGQESRYALSLMVWKEYNLSDLRITKGVEKITSIRDIRVILRAHLHHVDHRIYHKTPFFDEVTDRREKFDILMHQETQAKIGIYVIP